MTTIAVAGVGYWGKNLIRIFSEIAEVSTCVYTGTKENKQWVNNHHPSIELTTNYERVVTDPEIDAIVIATPIETHYEFTKKALNYGKDVFVEKPLAESTAETKILKEFAERKGCLLFVGYIFCYHPLIQPLLEQAQNQAVEWGRFSWDKLGSFKEDIILDTVTHPIAVALALFKEDPHSVELVQSTTLTNGVDVISTTLGFSSGKAFEIEINRLIPISQKSMQVLFENGELYCWMDDGLYQFSRTDNSYRIIQKSSREPLYAECEQFLSAIKGDSDVMTDAEFGHKVNNIIQRIQQNINSV